MALTSTEFATLKDALLLAFPQQSDLSSLLTFMGKNLEVITTSDGLSAMLDRVLTAATAEGWILQLVETARSRRAQAQDFLQATAPIEAALRARQAPAWHMPADPYQVYFLGAMTWFLDRTELRGALRQMNEQDFRVLVVRGEPRSGKTYSTRLIAFLQNTFNYNIAKIDFGEAVYGPDDLVRSILRQLGRPVDNLPPQQAQAAYWVHELRDWLLGEVGKLARPVWVVLDGFDEDQLQTSTQDLIRDLAVRINEDRQIPLRLVVLSHRDVQLHIDVDPEMLREQLERIDRPQVAEFFARLARDADPTSTPDKVAATVEHIFSDLPDPNAADHLRQLSRRVAEATRLFTTSQPAVAPPGQP